MHTLTTIVYYYSSLFSKITSVLYNSNSNDPPDVDRLTHLRPNVFYKGKEPLQIEFEVLDRLQVRNSNIYISVGALNTGLDQTLQVMSPLATTQSEPL